MTTFPIVETDCTISHDGHDYTAGGAVFDLDRGGYLYMETDNGRRQGKLTTWHGDYVGWYTIISKYTNNLGGRISCVQANIQGRSYHGRIGLDWNQCVKLTPSRH